MSRLTGKRLPQGQTSSACVIHVETGTNSLTWPVPAQRGAPSFTVDLTPFAKGDNRLGLPARPVLIGQLAPEFRTWSLDKSEGTIVASISYLRAFWRLIAALDERSRPLQDDITAITPAVGALFKNYLLYDLRVGTSFARRCLKTTQALIEPTRSRLGILSHRVLWPTVQEKRGTLHKDVDPAAAGRLYKAAKEVVRRFGRAHAEGKALLQDRREALPVSSTSSSPGEVACLTRCCLDDMLREPAALVHEIASRFFRRPRTISVWPRGYAEDRPFDRYRWFVPLAEDTVACLTLVLLHTGWNLDTVFNIDISSLDTWCQQRLGSDAEETVAIFSNKGRTNREQVAFSLTRPEFHPYRLIKDMTEHTEPLRADLRRKLAAVEKEPPTPSRQDRLLKLRKAIASPWLFLKINGSSGDPITGRVGVLERQGTFLVLFRTLLASAGLDLTLKPSDMRDAFASFLYENSLYNILLVKRALGHQSLDATKHYLRQRRMLAQRFADFTAWSDGLFDEIKRFQTVDPTILYIRVRFGDITADQRRRLADYRLRTRMGMGCLEPEHPPDQIAPMHSGGLCTVQRCILCRHGVIFNDSFVPLAQRLAELHVIRGHTPIDRWHASSFQTEWIAIEATVERVFPRRAQEFAEAMQAHLGRLQRGEAYLFDQIGVGAISGSLQ